MTAWPGLSAPRFSHWSETDGRTIAYLEDLFGEPVIARDRGADLEVGGKTVEVKSCREWIKAKPGVNNGTRRRRGRFKFWQTEHADLVLFVLVRETGELIFSLWEAREVFTRFGAGIRTLCWPEVFGQELPA